MKPTTKDAKSLERFLQELGPSVAVDRFLRGYGNVRTRCSYAMHLCLYLRWLKTREVTFGPDALVRDNLKAVFESAPTDVVSKRKHLDLLGEYVNQFLLTKGAGDSTRRVATAAISGFFKSNDSALFGYWKVAENPPTLPPPALHAEDVRKVLLAMDVWTRTPLIISWQSSIEINRVLGMDWATFLGKDAPVKIELIGRKMHRKQYSTFLGSDSLEHLRMIRSMPDYSTVRNHFREAARILGESGQLKNPDLRSWHPHNLRHSFETEASHAGVKSEVRDYFEGHLKGIQWVYNHRDEIHPEDLINEWLKVEPLVSLNPGRAVLENEYTEREQSLLRRIEKAESLLADLRSELAGSPEAQSRAPQAAT